MRERSKDLRVRRTIASIRKAFYELVLEGNYSDISITDLTDRAGINRKTFYLHYSGLDDLVAEIEEEIVSDILEKIGDEAEKLNMAGCIANFYQYMEDCNEIQQKLLCDDHYSFFYDAVTDTVLRSKQFTKFFEMTQYPSIVRSYTVAITCIYRNWLKDKKKIPFDTLVSQTCQLIEHGYSGVVKK
ncbi:MAG: TetR/AcrR family transcriptional regulator [Pseudobutyrivibrio sp.]|nr:TetR/AcrR family transcriptional regulator [Pseudobutyrivibrio sp.]